MIQIEREKLEKVLMALEMCTNQGMIPMYLNKNKEAITIIKDVLAQPEQDVDWEKLYRLEVKKKEALAAKYERDIKPLTRIVPMAQPEQEQSGFFSREAMRAHSDGHVAQNKERT